MTPTRTRLDAALLARGLADSREKAKRLVLAGAVRVDGQVAAKPSDLVTAAADLQVTVAPQYVSRGGFKLAAALAAFPIDCRGAVAVDFGASTGGFTDCLLQHGARKVYAVDVGKGQLDWRLRQDARVVVRDECNARYISGADIGEKADMITIDASFISLTLLLPAAVALLGPGGVIVALIKPQFEAGREAVGKGGVVRDPQVQAAVQDKIAAFARQALGLEVIGLVESPLRGPAGNREFLIGLRKPGHAAR